MSRMAIMCGVHEVFAGQAIATPDAPALAHRTLRVTYRELNNRANRMAAYLRRHGVRRGVLAALTMDRSIELIVSILAILKAGGAYVPIDPAHPRERITFMMKDSGCAVLLTEERLLNDLPNIGIERICVDRDMAAIAREASEATDFVANPNDLAYVMYTSGSTGTPKAVEIPHRGILRLVLGKDFFDSGPAHKFLQGAPISFDASVFEIWGALLHGAELILMDGRLPTCETIHHAIARQGVTTMWLTPAVFNPLIDESPELFLPIEQLVLGGEPLSVKHVCRALRMLPRTQLINAYGPTEISVFMCSYRIPRSFPDTASSVPVGWPIAGDEVYLIDEALRPVGDGAIGELCVAGAGLAHGYRGRPALTAETFVANPFGGVPGQRMYRTGDLARRLPNGVIELHGRRDHQVKIHGYRIELGEIEAALAAHPAVGQSTVIVRGDMPGGSALVAYVVAAPDCPFDTDALQAHLAARLPAYMIPKAVVPLASLPLTPNGKIDRSALPAPRHRGGKPAILPREGLESQIAQLWRGLLGVEAVGVTESFFDLGGTSVLILQLQHRIEAKLGRRVPITVLFEYRTIREFVEFLRASDDTRSWGARIEEQVRRRRQFGSGSRQP